MSNMKIIMRKVKDLNAAEYNPRQLTGEQFEQIKASMNRFGIVDPIIVNKHKDRMDIIVGGHQRVKVAREIGIEEVPTVEVNLPLAKERELNVRLNKNTGEFNFDALANNFDVDELVEWGFDLCELGQFDEVDDSGESSIPIEVKKMPSFVWVLIGCPLGKWAKLSDTIQAIAKEKEIVIEMTKNDG